MSLADLIEPLEWMNDAVCSETDPDLFFYENPRDRLSEVTAKSVCEGCPVVAQCAEYAIENLIPFGIWGGMTPAERFAVVRGRSRLNRREAQAWRTRNW